ncbi:MAG: nuclear transport factor 2 family protein, partial [Solirubrobacteraceae bacterium]
MSDAAGLVDRFQAAWSDHSGDGFAATCAADLHYEDPLTDKPLEGPAALAAHAARLWAACPDARLES